MTEKTSKGGGAGGKGIIGALKTEKGKTTKCGARRNKTDGMGNGGPEGGDLKNCPSCRLRKKEYSSRRKRERRQKKRRREGEKKR